MFIEMTDLSEATAAFCAFVRSLFGMNSLVNFKLRLVSAQTTAITTFVRVFTVKRPNVSCQKFFQIETFVTEFTHMFYMMRR